MTLKISCLHPPLLSLPRCPLTLPSVRPRHPPGPLTSHMDGHQALSASQIKRFSSAFRKFDTDKDGNINGKDLGKILRYIGHNPTEAEIQVRRCKLRYDDTVCGWEKVGVVYCSQLVSCFQEMIANADKDGTGTLDLIEFLQMMKEKISDQNKEEEIGEAFRVFDIV